jgi:uncharacterized protein (TIGR00369 family)
MLRALTYLPPLTEFTSPYAITLGLRRPGFLHGGAIAGLLENAAWVAVLEALPQGATIKPISVTVDYLRGGGQTETYAEAEIVRLGRRIANVLVTAWQDDRTKPIATANLKMMIERAG